MLPAARLNRVSLFFWRCTATGRAVLPCPLLPCHSPTGQEWAGQASPVEDNAQEGASNALGVVLASRRGEEQLA